MRRPEGRRGRKPTSNVSHQAVGRIRCGLSGFVVRNGGELGKGLHGQDYNRCTHQMIVKGFATVVLDRDVQL
jgi:hypothetical protein